MTRPAIRETTTSITIPTRRRSILSPTLSSAIRRPGRPTQPLLTFRDGNLFRAFAELARPRPQESGWESRTFRINMTIQPNRGTNNPYFKPPSLVEVYPTSHGRVAPPKPANANIKPAIWGAIGPNLRERVAIAMGKTEENPSPARLTPIAIAERFLAPNRTTTPTVLRTRPNSASFNSGRSRNSTGAVARPKSNAVQKSEGMRTHTVPAPATIRCA